MATGNNKFPEIMHPIGGFKLGTSCAGIKNIGRKDLVLMELAEQSTLAAVFTRNLFCAAPIQISKQHISSISSRYLIVNTGNANAGTGEQGLEDATRICAAVADLCRQPLETVLPFSTGVIGEKLPVEKILSALPDTVKKLSETGWKEAAEGILTTDTRPKGASIQINYQGKTISITGIAKGSGMIKPNMATMLSYVATDAVIAQPLLQKMLQQTVEFSFNRISVDGDTSTNDASVLVATSSSGVEITEQDQVGLNAFISALQQVMQQLAQELIRDGEGATKFVTVKVESAENSEEALAVAYAIAHSPLVKTALFASDPNWGRILAVVGRAGIKDLDIYTLQIYLGELCIVSAGGRDSNYSEQAGQEIMEQEDILIRVVLNRGNHAETIWTTDLSKDYVSINADYRS